MKRMFLLAPLALALSAPALAHPPGLRHGMGPVDAEHVVSRADGVLDEVDATEAQRSSVRAILEDVVPTLQAYREEALALRQDLRAIFTAEAIDRGALEEARTDLVDLVDRVSGTALGALADLAEVFTPEQRAELRELRESRRGLRGFWRSHGAADR